MTIKCAHCICNRRRWNEILPNSNVSHGNCTKLNLSLLLATIHTLGQGKPSKTTNNMRTESTTKTEIHRTKTTRKKEQHLTTNYPITIWWRNFCCCSPSTKWEHDAFHASKQNNQHIWPEDTPKKPKRWKEKVNGKQLALSRLGTQCIL